MELSYLPSFFLYAILPIIILLTIWLVRRRSKTEEEVFLTSLPDDLKASFLDAADYSRETSVKLNSTQKLQLYAYYKQTRLGDCSIVRPHVSDIYGSAKWDAWSKLRGVSAEEAAEKYIDIVGNYYPDFFEEEGSEYDGEDEGEEYDAEGEEGVEGEEQESDDEVVSHTDESSKPLVSGSALPFSTSLPEGIEGIKVGEASDWLNDHSIHDYVAEEKLSSVRRLLKHNASCVNASDSNGMRPLHWASDRNSLKLVNLLLSYHADVNALDSVGCPPLAYALRPNSSAIISALLAAGADPNRIPSSELTDIDTSVHSLLFPSSSTAASSS